VLNLQGDECVFQSVLRTLDKYAELTYYIFYISLFHSDHFKGKLKNSQEAKTIKNEKIISGWPIYNSSQLPSGLPNFKQQ